MIHVVASIELQSGQRGAFLKEFAALVPQVRAEQGCVEYSPAVDVATGLPMQAAHRDDVVVVIEKWVSESALRAHLSAPHVSAFLDRNQKLIANVTLQVLESA